MRRRITVPQRTLLHWLRFAGEYSRRVWGAELRVARLLARLRLATVWSDEGDWFAKITPKGRVEAGPRSARIERWGKAS